LYVPLQSAPPGQPVRLHIQSNDVSISTSPAGAHTSVLNVLEATIVEIGELDAASVEILLDVGAPLVATITRKSLVHLGLKPGQQVYAQIKTMALNEEVTD
jgi:molybdate transport system ATP-binding protein